MLAFVNLSNSKMSLDMVYLLWDIYIVENDTCFQFFIGLAMLLENKNVIIGSEYSMIPQTLANLTIQNSTQMKQIYKRYHLYSMFNDKFLKPQAIISSLILFSLFLIKINRAIDLRLRTPASFLGKLRELGIFKKGFNSLVISPHILGYASSNEYKIRIEKDVEYLESLQCLFISSHEIINAFYGTEITCSDPECLKALCQ